jgi:HK97 gp10 family phage protein
MFSVKVDGLDVLIKKISQLSDDAKLEVQNELKAFSIQTVTDAKSLVQSNSSDTGQLASSIEYQVNDLQAKISARAAYAAFVEFGTRKFAAQEVAKLPPDWQNYAATFKGKKTGNFDQFLQRLIQWGKNKGFDERGAYLLALKIMEEGTPAKPFLYPSITKNLSIFMKNVKDIFKI